MNSLKINRLQSVLAWLTSWKSDVIPNRRDTVGDCSNNPKCEMIQKIKLCQKFRQKIRQNIRQKIRQNFSQKIPQKMNMLDWMIPQDS